MAKVTGPLLSLSAHGSVGKTVTFVRGNSFTLARGYASHPDAKTEGQLKWRELYNNGCKLWANLSSSEKLALKITGAKLTMSGFNKYLRSFLRSKPTYCGTAFLGMCQLGDLTQ